MLKAIVLPLLRLLLLSFFLLCACSESHRPGTDQDEESDRDIDQEEILIDGLFEDTDPPFDTDEPAPDTDTGEIACSLSFTGEIGGPAFDVATAGDILLVARGQGGLYLYDASDPRHPVLLSHVQSNFIVQGVFASEGLAYLVGTDDSYSSGALQIVDIHDPEHPKAIGARPLTDIARKVAVANGHAFIANQGAGLAVVDVSNPSAPGIPVFVATSGNAGNVHLLGSVAYVSHENGLAIIDVADPTAPRSLFSLLVPRARGIAFHNGYAYVAGDSHGLTILDVSSPASPKIKKTVGSFGYAADVAIDGAYAYVASDDQGLVIYDISDPLAPAFAGWIDTAGDALAIAVSNGHAFLAADYAGVRIVDLQETSAPVEVAALTAPVTAFAVKVSGDIAYVADYEGGLQVIDVSDPARPFGIARSRDIGFASWDIELMGDIAVASDYYRGGLHLFDITDPTDPVRTGWEVSGQSERNYGRGFLLVDDRAYLAGNGLAIFDLSDPEEPTLLSATVFGNNTSDVAVRGRYAFLVDWDGLLWVADISNPHAPRFVTNLQVGEDSFALTRRGDRLFVADRVSGVTIVDIADPTSPAVIRSTPLADGAKSVVFKGALAFVTGNETLRIFLLDDDRLTKIAELELPDYAYGMTLDDTHAYIADSGAGLQIVRYECSGVEPVEEPDDTPDDIMPDEDYELPDDTDLTPDDAPLYPCQGAVLSSFGGQTVDITGRPGTLFTLNSPRGVAAYDVTDPAHPAPLSFHALPFHYQAVSIAVKDHYLLVAGDSSTEFFLVDASDPFHLIDAGSIPLKGVPEDILVSGNYLYVALSGYSIQIFDIADPTAPVELAILALPASPGQLALDGDTLFTVTSGLANTYDGMLVIDVTDRTDPRLIGTFFLPYAQSIAADGGVAYLEAADPYNARLVTVDVSDPSRPVEADRFEGEGGILTLTDGYLYSAEGSDLAVYDLADPLHPQRIASRAIGDMKAFGVFVQDGAAYLRGIDTGLSVVDVTTPDLPSLIFSNLSPSDHTEAVALSGDYAYLGDRAFGAGISQINITAPELPFVIDAINFSGAGQDVFVSGDNLFVAAFYNLMIVDISNPLDLPTPRFVDTEGIASGVHVQNGFAYVASWDNGLAIVDLTPGTPVVVGTVDTPGKAAEVFAAGDHAYIADSETGLQVVDASDPAAPAIVATLDTPGEALGLFVEGSYAYVADGPYFLVVDISDPTTPAIVAQRAVGGYAQDVFLQGSLAYVAAYGGGLVLFDITDPAAPELTGQIAVYGEPTGVVVRDDLAFLSEHNGSFEIVRLTCE